MSNPTAREKCVAYQGLAGSFSSMAARLLYGPEINSVNTVQFREIFDRVMDESADVGVLPIENAVAGSVHENYDLLAEYPCSIVAETYVPVQLHLMGRASTQQIKKVYSHHKALEQCSIFFERSPDLEAIVWSDTAGAAHHVSMLGDPTVAAIASEEAAAIYSLSILRRSVQNHISNSTRFVAISKTSSDEPKPTKCSLIVSLAHRPGSLYTILGEIAQLQLNLTKIESRPILGAPFSYSFHIYIECPPGQSAALIDATQRIQKTAEKLKILGFYRSYH
jgi:chorismate mutase/prephenate dehydratase